MSFTLSVLSLLTISLDILDLNKSIQDMPDNDPRKPEELDRLGQALWHRFQQTQYRPHIDNCVRAYRLAVSFTKEGDPNEPAWLNNFGIALLTRFQYLKHVDDSDESLSVLLKAVYLTPDDHHDKDLRLDTLLKSLEARIAFCSNPDPFIQFEGIHKFAPIYKETVHLVPDKHSQKLELLRHLGVYHFRRFTQLGHLADINESVEISRQALSLAGDDSTTISCLNVLGPALFRRFCRLGDSDDIMASVSHLERALRLCRTSNDHADNTIRILDNLADSLTVRFQYLGDTNDINRSIQLRQEALGFLDDRNLDKPASLHNLGIAFLTRFDKVGDAKNGDVNDIDQAIAMIEEALCLAGEKHFLRPLMLNHLGESFYRRFEKLGDRSWQADIDRSVEIFEDLVRITADQDPSKCLRLRNMGYTLWLRFKLCDSGNSDIDRSVLMSERAVELTPKNHPDRPSFLHTLAVALHSRFERLGNNSDLERAFDISSLAPKSPAGSTYVRFYACVTWASLAQSYRHSSAMEAYSLAMELLPSFVWSGLSIADRHRLLLKAESTVRDAAAFAIAAEDYEKAIEWLEQGRSIVWTQLLQLRTPIDDLEEKHPDIAQELKGLNMQLQTASTRSPDATMPMSNPYIEAGRKRDELVKHIQTLEGFESFLLPQKLSQLVPHATLVAGPVVIVNVSHIRCDALVVMQDEEEVSIIPVPLEDFTLEMADDMQKKLSNLISGHSRQAPEEEDRGAKLVSTRRHFQGSQSKSVLSDLWTYVAKPILEGIALDLDDPAPADPTRIWWCLTGPLASLPIHAAELYKDNVLIGPKVSDFVISSYIPTLGSLGRALHGDHPQKNQLLTVSLPSESRLNHSQEEVEEIKRHAGSFPILDLVESKATVENVEQGMLTSSWAHFACHGVQNMMQPTESALLLSGESRLLLSRIIELSIPHAQFAFLSACQTATGTEKLADESVHLAAGMLSAGYRGVIGTIWSVKDSDAKQVADVVYGHLFKTATPDPRDAALALHIAVKKLRESHQEDQSFLGWVPFIHIGI